MYVFKSKADGDVMMMDPVGDQILRIIGRAPAEQGIIEAAALPAAIGALQQAIATADRDRRDDRAQRGDDDESAGGAPAVGLAQRAWPMLEMMRHSLAERADIVWGV